MSFSSQDTLLFAGAISLLFVSGFLCWVLYELARMLRQTNDLLEDTREKITRVEEFVSEISERVGSASQYLGIMASAGKEIFGWMQSRKQASLRDEEDELSDEEPPKRKRKRS